MYNTEQLEEFKKVQRLAYQCAKDISHEMKEGWTEKQTAKLMDTYLKDHGVKVFFHQSFAWFGERARYRGFKKYRDFYPSERVLKPEDIVILDTAPILNGYMADIGYSFSLTPQTQLEKAKKYLLDLRGLIPRLFESKDYTTQKIWQTVDEDLKRMGYDNIHSKYPFSVLGHKVHTMPLSSWRGITSPFSLHSFFSIFSRGLWPELLGPKHDSPKEGLWAIEPHLGINNSGIKFEEILVYQNDKAYWLDEGLW